MVRLRPLFVRCVSHFSVCTDSLLKTQAQTHVIVSAFAPSPEPLFLTRRKSKSSIDSGTRVTNVELHAARSSVVKDRYGGITTSQMGVDKFTYFHKLWIDRYNDLKAYKAKHGDCNVPTMYPPNQPLANWVVNQRTQYRYLMQNDNPHREKTQRKSSFDKFPERVKFLNDIDFEWELTGWEDTWDQRFEELNEYYEENGNCLVPHEYVGKQRSSQPLGNWVNVQRKQYMLLQEGKGSTMTKERIKKLEGIGFVWDAQEASWFESFEKLEEYKNKYGNGNVPYAWEEDVQLGGWVITQRTQYRLFQEGKESHMTKERIEILEDLGFIWNQQEANWFERFDELKKYKEVHGDCNVPRGWNENVKLGRWVSLQRTEYRLLQEGETSQMTKERIKLLESIRFKWSLINRNNAPKV